MRGLSRICSGADVIGQKYIGSRKDWSNFVRDPFGVDRIGQFFFFCEDRQDWSEFI